MIQKHPALLPLIHRPESTKGAADPFLEAEEDPQKTKALESSLWELEALESHYCPSVRTLSGSFHTLFSELKVTVLPELCHSDAPF